MPNRVCLNCKDVFDARKGQSRCRDCEAQKQARKDSERGARYDSPAYRENAKTLKDAKGAACLVCGTTKNLTIDHDIPLSKGGTNSLENLNVLCAFHNSQKGGRSLAEYAKWIESKRIPKA